MFGSNGKINSMDAAFHKGGDDGADTTAPSPLLPLGPKPALLDGESLTNVVKPVAYTLSRKRGGGGEFNGALHITNFRLILQRTGASQVGGRW